MRHRELEPKTLRSRVSLVRVRLAAALLDGGARANADSICSSRACGATRQARSGFVPGAVARLAWLAVRRASTRASLACLFSTCQYLIQNCHGRITVPISVASRCDAAGERAVDVLKQSSNLRRRPFATARCRDITLVQSRCNGPQ